MATPEIKSKQVNTADLKSQKTTSSSMPKTETTSSEKLASTLSGNKTTTFGKLSKDNSLTSSLSTKAGSTTSTTSSVFGGKTESSKTSSSSVFGSSSGTSSTKSGSVFGDSDTSSAKETTTTETTSATTSDVSIYEQTSIKSGVSSVQSDVISTQNLSIFSSLKSGSSSKSSSSNLDFSSSAFVTTSVSEAKDLASSAKTEYDNGNYMEARKLYQNARKKLTEATAEINKAKRKGEDLSKYSSEISTLNKTYQDKSDECVSKYNTSNKSTCGYSSSSGSSITQNQMFASTYAQYMADTNQAWAERSTFMGGVSTCGGVKQPGFWATLWNGIAQKAPEAFANSVGTTAGNAIAGSALGAVGLNNVTVQQNNVQNNISNGSGSAGSSSGAEKSGGTKSLDTKGVEDNAEVKREEVKFKASQSKESSASSQLKTAEGKKDTIDKQIGDLKNQINNETGKLKDNLQKYEKAKANAEKNKQTVTDLQTQANEKQSVCDELTERKESLNSQYTSQDSEANSAEIKSAQYKNFTLTQKQGAVTQAEAEYNVAPQEQKQAALIKLKSAEAEYIKAQEESERLDADAKAKREKATATKKELTEVSQKFETANNELNGADGIKAKLKTAQDEQAGLDEKVKIEGIALEESTDKAQRYKDRIDDLYGQQTDAAGNISELKGVIQAEKDAQGLSQDTVDDIKARYENKQRSDYNPVKWAVGLKNTVCDWF